MMKEPGPAPYRRIPVTPQPGSFHPGAMKYRILEIDLTVASRSFRLDADERGFAILVRHRDRLVGFHLQASSPGAAWSGERLDSLAAGAAADAVVAHEIFEGIRSETVLDPPPSLTIAVCTRNRPTLLARCLAGIVHALEHASRPSFDVDVLVVDNAPSDELTKRQVERTTGVRYVVEPRAGLDFARNRAWREARGDFVAYIDDDAVVDRNWIEGFLCALEVHPDAGAVTGLVLPLALETKAQILFEKRGGWRRGFLPMRHAGADRIDDPFHPVGAGVFGAGCNMVIRRDLLETLSGFDEALDTGPPLPGGGDLDIFYRVVRSGAPLVYQPTLAVFHEHRRDMTGLRHQYYTWGLGFHAFLAKILRDHPEDRRKVNGLRRWWIRYMLRVLVSGTGPPRMVLAELRGGIVGFCGAYERSRARSNAIREALR